MYMYVLHEMDREGGRGGRGRGGEGEREGGREGEERKRMREKSM